MSSTSWLRTVDLCRFYKRGRHEIHALDSISLGVEKGEFLGVVGSSGSGKSTLLNLLAGLDTPTSGFVEFNGAVLSSLSRKKLASYRAHSVGMIFQSFNLVPHYTALQNVETALLFNGTQPKDRRKLAEEILEFLGLADRISHKPSDLSGGEQQRVAVARAIVKKPEILFADEPTGNLDFENSQNIAQLLMRLNSAGLTIIMVTHNLEMASECSDRTIRMQYGKVV
ncbi:MAG TPA: ABC transporter ATP-binding protein [Bacteroidota bacterium]|nr:ABC transporter ATP-binding protein [Bacteroidota bacterium]